MLEVAALPWRCAMICCWRSDPHDHTLHGSLSPITVMITAVMMESMPTGCLVASFCHPCSSSLGAPRWYIMCCCTSCLLAGCGCGVDSPALVGLLAMLSS